MTPNTTRATMTNTTKYTRNSTTFPQTISHAIRTLMRLSLLPLAGYVFIAGCGPDFDPASLIKDTRVVGARIEVEGAPERATPTPGETANVTWLVTSRDAAPPLAWTFVACLSETVEANIPLRCLEAPLARFDGTASPPRISIPIPSGSALGQARSLSLYGQICAGVDASPIFVPGNTLPSCTSGRGTTVSLAFPLQLDADANHNPTADRAFTFDGETWPAGAIGDDPCVLGPRVAPGSKGHIIGNTTDSSDREAYMLLVGDPPVATTVRERLQISQFTTAGELKSQFSFVEASDDRATPSVEVTWEAPELAEIPADGMKVTFTFVTRDDRGGTDWTARTLCVTR
jgi:hypothetical protein